MDPEGKVSVVIISASGENDAWKSCVARKLEPVEIHQIKSRKAARKFSSKTIFDFTEMMSIMLNAGLTIRDAIDISVTTDSKNDQLLSLMEHIREKMTGGRSFPDILAELGQPFTPFYIGMIRIGEKLGRLGEIFSKLSDYMRDRKKLKDRIINALIYPSIVLGMLVAGIFFLVFFLFPQFNETFGPLMGDGGIESTMSGARQAMSIIALVLAALILYIVFYFIWGKRIHSLKNFMQNILYRTPVVGSIFRLRELMSFTFSMETLTEAGYTIEAALEQSKNVISSLPLTDGINTIRDSLVRGNDLSYCFSKAKIFPAIFSRWTLIGEKTGNITPVFGKLKDYYSNELENRTSRVMNLVEPIIIAAVGVILLIAIITLILPMLDIYSI